MRDVTRIALDTSSRTSAALTRILCARRFEIDPVFIPRPPDLRSMLADADAALLIGDPALFVDARAHGAMKIDLGAEWTAMTHRPFVWAFWAGPSGGVDAPVVALLQEAAAEGMRHTDAIADAYCAETPDRAPLARRYLRQHLMFQLTPRAIDGLREYYSLAAALGLAAERRDLVFF